MYYYYSLYVKILHYVCTIITLRNPGNPHKYWIFVIFFFFSFLSGGFGILICPLGQVKIPGFAQPSDLEKSRILSRGKVSICSQGEALGGIAERPLTAIFPYNGLRGRDACRWRFLLINAGGSPLKPWALPTPSRTFSPAPVLPGALPPDPHNSPL
jgi:hypothetical protein